jgi:hypothetical protein
VQVARATQQHIAGGVRGGERWSGTGLERCLGREGRCLGVGRCLGDGRC